ALRILISMRYCGPINGREQGRRDSLNRYIVKSAASALNPNYDSRLKMLLHIARVLLILFEVLILFNLLIVVHELGHFLAARWRGLYIEKFGVWFVKLLWKKTIYDVQYSLGSL